jgi:hypothetical protein
MRCRQLGAVGALDGVGGPPGQVLGQGQVGLGVAAGLVAGEGDAAEDAGPSRQRRHQRRADVEGGEQLQVVGVAGQAAEVGRGGPLQQERPAGRASTVSPMAARA